MSSSYRRREARKARQLERREAHLRDSLARARAQDAEKQAPTPGPERPTAGPGEDTVIVWHPTLGFVDRWVAIAHDKALLNDAHYPLQPTREEKISRVADQLAMVEDAMDEAQEAREQARLDCEEQEAEAALLAKIIASMEHLEARLTKLEEARRERRALDEEVAQAMAENGLKPAAADEIAEPPLPLPN